MGSWRVWPLFLPPCACRGGSSLIGGVAVVVIRCLFSGWVVVRLTVRFYSLFPGSGVLCFPTLLVPGDGVATGLLRPPRRRLWLET